MAEVLASDGTPLHVEVDGAGVPVTVLAHGLTNSCKELSAFTPMAPGTKAIVLVALASTAGIPAAMSAGKVTRVPAPATEFIMPAIIAATTTSAS